MTHRLPVVGIGADGLDGLSPTARRVLAAAPAVHGSPRQVRMLEGLGPELHVWPSPLVPALDRLAEEMWDSGAAVVASGDPMFHGIGNSLAARLGAERLAVYPAPSTASLAAARMGLPTTALRVVSCVTAEPAAVLAVATPGTPVLVLCRDRGTPGQLAEVLVAAGLGVSRLTVLTEMGGPAERREDLRATELAAELATDPGARPPWGDLCVVVLDPAREPGHPAPAAAGPAPGLPDTAFADDGQLTRRALRAQALSLLRPNTGAVLWDVGAGAGSIGIEWMRCDPGARAIAFERDPVRAGRITANARALGVPGLQVVTGSAPEVLSGRTERPDAVFVGGGGSAGGVLERCWAALAPGGRMVVAAVTLDSEAALLRWRERHGGELVRTHSESAEPLGRYLGWSPARAVVHLSCTKPVGETAEGDTADHDRGGAPQ